LSLEEALAARRSVREFAASSLTLQELSQLLWACYGVTDVRHEFKTTPSAGATYPLEVYVVVSSKGVVGPESSFLEAGSYKYDQRKHAMKLVRGGDVVEELYEACLRQEWVREAPVNIVLTAVFERTTSYYGERGVRYVWIEVGHAGQNVYLQATALGLATVAIGAFYDDAVRKAVGARPEEAPVYVMPVGRPTWKHRLTESDLERFFARWR